MKSIRPWQDKKVRLQKWYKNYHIAGYIKQIDLAKEQ